MLATISQFGTSGSYTWLDYWKALKQNDVLVSDGWTRCLLQRSSAAPAAKARARWCSPTPPAQPLRSSSARPTRSQRSRRPATSLAGSFLQIEFVGILKGTQQRDPRRAPDSTFC